MGATQSLKKAIDEGNLKKSIESVLEDADLDYVDKNGRNFVEYARTKGQNVIANYINAERGLKTKKDGQLDEVQEDGFTYLSFAAKHNITTLAERTLEKGAGIDAMDRSGYTPLLHAVESNHTDLAITLLKAGANPNLNNNWAQTPLSFAATNRNLDLLEALVNAGASPDCFSNTGVTPLIRSAINDFPDVVEFLLKAKASTDVGTTTGETALYTAAGKGLTEIVRLLLKYGSNPNLSNKDGVTPVTNAVKSRNLETVTLIVESGGDVNLSANDRTTALMHAVNEFDILRYLINQGAELNAIALSGQTALSRSLELRNFRSAQLLIDNGANMTIGYCRGQTVRDFLTQSNILVQTVDRHPQSDIDPQQNNILYIPASAEQPLTYEAKVILPPFAEQYGKPNSGTTEAVKTSSSKPISIASSQSSHEPRKGLNSLQLDTSSSRPSLTASSSDINTLSSSSSSSTAIAGGAGAGGNDEGRSSGMGIPQTQTRATLLSPTAERRMGSFSTFAATPSTPTASSLKMQLASLNQQQPQGSPSLSGMGFGRDPSVSNPPRPLNNLQYALPQNGSHARTARTLRGLPLTQQPSQQSQTQPGQQSGLIAPGTPKDAPGSPYHQSFNYNNTQNLNTVGGAGGASTQQPLTPSFFVSPNQQQQQQSNLQALQQYQQQQQQYQQSLQQEKRPSEVTNRSSTSTSNRSGPDTLSPVELQHQMSVLNLDSPPGDLPPVPPVPPLPDDIPPTDDELPPVPPVPQLPDELPPVPSLPVEDDAPPTDLPPVPPLPVEEDAPPTDLPPVPPLPVDEVPPPVVEPEPVVAVEEPVKPAQTETVSEQPADYQEQQQPQEDPSVAVTTQEEVLYAEDEDEEALLDETNPDEMNPKNWRAAFDPESGDPYYYNIVTTTNLWSISKIVQKITPKCPKCPCQNFTQHTKRPARCTACSHDHC